MASTDTEPARSRFIVARRRIAHGLETQRARIMVDALALFDQAVPHLRSIRNPLTHPSDDNRLDGVAWFDSVVRLLPNGSVEYLVDPRHEHHDAALELIRALGTYLQADPFK